MSIESLILSGGLIKTSQDDLMHFPIWGGGKRSPFCPESSGKWEEAIEKGKVLPMGDGLTAYKGNDLVGTVTGAFAKTHAERTLLGFVNGDLYLLGQPWTKVGDEFWGCPHQSSRFSPWHTGNPALQALSGVQGLNVNIARLSDLQQSAQEKLMQMIQK